MKLMKKGFFSILVIAILLVFSISVPNNRFSLFTTVQGKNSLAKKLLIKMAISQTRKQKEKRRKEVLNLTIMDGQMIKVEFGFKMARCTEEKDGQEYTKMEVMIMCILMEKYKFTKQKEKSICTKKLCGNDCCWFF